MYIWTYTGRHLCIYIQYMPPISRSLHCFWKLVRNPCAWCGWGPLLLTKDFLHLSSWLFAKDTKPALGGSAGALNMIVVRFWHHPVAPHVVFSCFFCNGCVFSYQNHKLRQRNFHNAHVHTKTRWGQNWSYLEQFNIQSICSYHVPLPMLQWRPNSASFSQVIKLGYFKSRIQWSNLGRVRKTKSWIPFHVCPLTKCI